MARVLATAALTIGSLYQIDEAAVKKIINGMIVQLVAKNHFDELNVCFHDVKAIDKDLEAAFNDFKVRDQTSILDAISHLGNIMVALPEDTVDCTGSIKDDIDRIKKWAAIFTDPKMALPTIWQNLMTNYADIISQLDKFNNFVEKNKFGYAGRKISCMLIDVLGPVPDVVYPDDFDKDPQDVDSIEYT